MEELIWKHVVLNAKKYGKPNAKAVIGKVISENPELKNQAKILFEKVKEIIEEFENLNDEKKRELFEKFEEKRKVEKREDLPPLPNADRVVMRFAPNPNGPATLGSARGIVINSEYAKMYKGKFILRFDDTDPRTKRPLLEAYDWYLEDCEWLDAKPDKVIYASKRIHVYYEYAKKLIEMGKAYVCKCSREEFKKFKESGEECPHRNREIEENLDDWEKMLNGEYDEGEAVLRIKTDMKHKDPAIRDWVAFRIIYADHPLVGDRYIVYPTLDFESAIEDHLQGVTHIFRGKDLADSEKRQRFIYEYFGWEYPLVKLWGRIRIQEFGKLSTSLIRKGIEEGRYSGWDDPRLPTLRSLRRRGFEPEAIRRFFISLGVGENDVSVSMKNLHAENRKIVDKKANRYFFVWDPVRLELVGLEEPITVEVPLHPEKGGVRKLTGEKSIYMTQDDYETFRGKIVRLKGFCSVRIEDGKAVVVEDTEFKKGKNIIHWLPESQAVPCKVLGIERDYKGFVEANAKNDVGRVVQFERFAFCRIEKFEEEALAIYTHE